MDQLAECVLLSLLHYSTASVVSLKSASWMHSRLLLKTTPLISRRTSLSTTWQRASWRPKMKLCKRPIFPWNHIINYIELVQCYKTVYVSSIHTMTCSKFAESIPRPFTIHYNPYTHSVEVVNNKKGLQILASDIKYDVAILEDAIKNNMLENNVEVCPLNLDW